MTAEKPLFAGMQKKTAFSFLTGNSHKFQEAKEALAQFPGIELSQIIEEKTEFKDDNASDPISEIAKKAAIAAVKKYKVPVAVEDAGIFFNAYPGFPGLNTKWVMRNISYDGILRLLDGKDRTAYFRSVVAYYEPSQLQREEEPLLFEGRIEGSISAEVIGNDVDCMDYDRIFIPSGETRTFSLIMEDKRKMSHRKIAFQKLGEFLLKKTV
jgi:XTP/dITP diphosphohydrolase